VVRDSGGPVSNTLVAAVRKDGSGSVVADGRTDTDGRYQLSITEFDQFFDIFVAGRDTGFDTPRTSIGCREIRDLRIN